MYGLYHTQYLLRITRGPYGSIEYTSGNLVWTLMDTYAGAWEISHTRRLHSTSSTPYSRLTVF